MHSRDSGNRSVGFPIESKASAETRDEDGIDRSRFVSVLRGATFHAFHGEEDYYQHDQDPTSGDIERNELSDEEPCAVTLVSCDNWCMMMATLDVDPIRSLQLAMFEHRGHQACI